MRAFFGGNYQRSLQVLAQAEKLTPLTAGGHFYRACSLAALASVTAAPDEDKRLSQALQSYRVAARAPDQFRQDLTYHLPEGVRAAWGALNVSDQRFRRTRAPSPERGANRTLATLGPVSE